MNTIRAYVGNLPPEASASAATLSVPVTYVSRLGLAAFSSTPKASSVEGAGVRPSRLMLGLAVLSVVGCGSAKMHPTTGTGGTSGGDGGVIATGGSGIPGSGSQGGSGASVGQGGGGDSGAAGQVGSGGAGAAGQVGSGGAGTAGQIGSGGAGGGPPVPCHTDRDCPYGEACLINAPITDCLTAPEGVCTSRHGGNCQLHGTVCDCLDGLAARPCAAFPDTVCKTEPFTSLQSDPNRCWGCFPRGGPGGQGGGGGDAGGGRNGATGGEGGGGAAGNGGAAGTG
jgi:hypothetical protein